MTHILFADSEESAFMNWRQLRLLYKDCRILSDQFPVETQVGIKLHICKKLRYFLSITRKVLLILQDTAGYPLCINPAHQHITLNNWSTIITVACLMTHVLYFKALLLIVCIHFSLLKMYSVNGIGLHRQIWEGRVQKDLPYSAIVSHFFRLPLAWYSTITKNN